MCFSSSFTFLPFLGQKKSVSGGSPSLSSLGDVLSDPGHWPALRMTVFTPTMDIHMLVFRKEMVVYRISTPGQAWDQHCHHCLIWSFMATISPACSPMEKLSLASSGVNTHRLDACHWPGDQEIQACLASGFLCDSEHVGPMEVLWMWPEKPGLDPWFATELLVAGPRYTVGTH